MLPDLEIKILFCYSPEVLAKTYLDLNQLQDDNEILCEVLEDVLNNNITTYNVSVIMVDNIEVRNLQTQWYFPFSLLSMNQLQSLVQAPSTSYFYKRFKFGSLPNTLLELKENNFATVVVLEVALKPEYEDEGVSGVAAKLGITKATEAFVGIGRTLNTRGDETYVLDAIILAHEFGHLMGCRHPKGKGDGFDNTNGNAHGHCVIDAAGEIECGTIMSYAKEPIWYYSNPNIFEYAPPNQNVPCGIAGESEAYKTVNDNVQKLAGIFTP